MAPKTTLALILISLIGITACTPPQVKFSSLETLQHHIHPRRSNLPAYELTGGVWVKEQPLFINHDFDFSVAMGIPDIGPAIAAGQRKKKNEDAAALFEALPRFALHAQFNKAVKNLGQGKRLGGEVRLYGILFGNPQAHLKVILEVVKKTDAAPEGPTRFIFVTESLPLKGDNSWSAHQGDQLASAFASALPALVELWQSPALQAPTSPALDYQFSNEPTTQKGSGWIVEENEDRLLIFSKSIPKTVFSYPRSDITRRKP